MDPIVCSDIRNAVVKKCLSYGSIVHVYVDKRSAHVSHDIQVYMYMYMPCSTYCVHALHALL